jgi:hypothetical protein
MRRSGRIWRGDEEWRRVWRGGGGNDVGERRGRETRARDVSERRGCGWTGGVHIDMHVVAVVVVQ